MDEWEEHANAVYFVEDARSAWDFFLLVNQIQNAPVLLESAQLRFDSLNAAQRQPYELLAKQDLERHAQQIQDRNMFFVPGSNWPRRFNDGATIFHRCASCFALNGHFPECHLHPDAISVEEGPWDRLYLSKTHYQAMLLLDAYLDGADAAPARICESCNGKGIQKQLVNCYVSNCPAARHAYCFRPEPVHMINVVWMCARHSDPNATCLTCDSNIMECLCMQNQSKSAARFEKHSQMLSFIGMDKIKK